MIRTRALFFAIGVFLGHDVLAQPPATSPDLRSITAIRLAVGESVDLDGELGESAWSRALPAADFRQIDPTNGAPATEATEVRIVYDDEAIYLGVTCYDSEPDRWIGYQRRRDEFLPADDRFMWTIDTFLDERSGYFFEMNPSGLMADSLFGVNGDNRAWDGIWNARVRHSAIGWTIEIQIPFRTLNFNPDVDAWGANFQRTVRRKNEDSIWTGWARNQGLRRMTNAGRISGISRTSRGGLDVKPYGLVSAQSSPGREDADLEGNHAAAGVDLFYNPTPLLRANLTVNTDFAQTEVDQRQVNLTRFSLFFPERRDFFLDGAIFFDFGSSAGSGGGGGSDLLVNPFFSRRVGLSAEATPQRIDFGTKLTGQVGNQDVGVLHVRTGNEDNEGLIGEDFTVARVKRRLLQQSYVGGIYTRRAPRDGRDASHTAGVDVRLATTRFLGSQNLEATGWFVHAANPSLSGENKAFGAVVSYPNDRWDARVDLREVQARFDPAVGFVTRRDYRRYRPSLAFQPRPDGHRHIRRFVFNGSLDTQTNLANTLLTRELELTLVETQFHSQDSFGVGVNSIEERLDEPFAISGDITLPAGNQYSFTRFHIRGQTANRRVLALNGRFEVGDFYSGTRRQTVLNWTVRMRPGYLVYLNTEWNSVSLAEGDFSSNVFRVVGEAQFTPWAALVNNVQYDTVSRVAGWQSRFRWIMKPGNDLYLVYTHNWLDEPTLNRFVTFDRRFASKVLYTHRF